MDMIPTIRQKTEIGLIFLLFRLARSYNYVI